MLNPFAAVIAAGAKVAGGGRQGAFSGSPRARTQGGELEVPEWMEEDPETGGYKLKEGWEPGGGPPQSELDATADTWLEENFPQYAEWSFDPDWGAIRTGQTEQLERDIARGGAVQGGQLAQLGLSGRTGLTGAAQGLEQWKASTRARGMTDIGANIAEREMQLELLEQSRQDKFEMAKFAAKQGNYEQAQRYMHEADMLRQQLENQLALANQQRMFQQGDQGDQLLQQLLGTVGKGVYGAVTGPGPFIPSQSAGSTDIYTPWASTTGIPPATSGAYTNPYDPPGGYGELLDLLEG